MTTATTVSAEEISGLSAAFSGALLLPDDAGYEEARRVHNGMIDRRPALIARPVGPADIADAVNFARDQGLAISVRGGGHNVAGTAVADGALMIDLSSMKGMHVDPAERICRAQAGLTWAQFNRETERHRLATTGGVIGTTGVAGLTLGGGLGWLMGKHGLSVDNLRSVELVTATGEIVRASADENPDLFWGLRGGGGNFGVASSFEFQLHPLDGVYGGLIAFPFAAARDVLRFYREFTSTLPDEITAFAGLLSAPEEPHDKLAAIIVCHSGDQSQAESDLAPLRGIGSPALDALGPLSYGAINGILDDGFPKGAHNYWKSNFLQDLSDDVIEATVAAFETCPSPMSSLLLEHFHGAATRVGATETAFPHRDPGYNFVALGQWPDATGSDTNVAWTRAAYAAVEPFMSSGRYVNYLGEDEGENPAAAAYGPNYARLLQLKREWDPDNLFHLNQNIRPGD